MTAPPDPVQDDPVRALVIEARRNQILDAAAAVFAAQGFHQATIRQIANAAGVADGTIYNYFANKSDLLMGLITRLGQTEHIEPHFAAAGPSADFRTTFRALLAGRIALLAAHRELFQAVLPEILTNDELRAAYREQVIGPALDLLEAHLVARAEAGQIRPVDTALTARLLHALEIGLLVLHLVHVEDVLPENDADYSRLAQALVSFVYNGLRPPGDDTPA